MNTKLPSTMKSAIQPVLHLVMVSALSSFIPCVDAISTLARKLLTNKSKQRKKNKSKDKSKPMNTYKPMFVHRFVLCKRSARFYWET